MNINLISVTDLLKIYSQLLTPENSSSMITDQSSKICDLTEEVIAKKRKGSTISPPSTEKNLKSEEQSPIPEGEVLKAASLSSSILSSEPPSYSLNPIFLNFQNANIHWDDFPPSQIPPMEIAKEKADSSTSSLEMTEMITPVTHLITFSKEEGATNWEDHALKWMIIGYFYGYSNNRIRSDFFGDKIAPNTIKNTFRKFKIKFLKIKNTKGKTELETLKKKAALQKFIEVNELTPQLYNMLEELIRRGKRSTHQTHTKKTAHLRKKSDQRHCVKHGKENWKTDKWTDIIGRFLIKGESSENIASNCFSNAVGGSAIRNASRNLERKIKNNVPYDKIITTQKGKPSRLFKGLTKELFEQAKKKITQGTVR